MIHIWFKFLRLLDNDIPSSQEAKWALDKYPHTERVKIALRLRSVGISLEIMSTQVFNCTRERIRQLLMKGIRQSKGVL